MGALTRVSTFLLAKQVDKRSVLERLLLKRILSLYGVSAVVLLIKLRKPMSRSQRALQLQEFFRNSSGLAMASTLIPLIRLLVGLQNDVVPWSVAVGSALAISTDLPSWLSSYVAVESISDAAMSTEVVKGILASMSDSSLTMGRQVLFCLLIPLFHLRVDKQSSRAARFLLSRRSLGRDFVLFYSTWNFLSVYVSLKSLLIDTRPEKSYKSQQYSSRQVDEWPMISSNLKPLMDKLGEIHEITLHDSYSLFEKIMNSALINNVMPCLKWALWRQLCVRTITHRPPTRHDCVVGTSLMKSIILMLGFFVLDGNDNRMNVRPGVLRYLVRSTLTAYLKNTSLNVQRLVTFLGSHLALQNVAQQANHSK